MIPISKPFIGEEEKAAVLAVLSCGMLAQGPKVKELEEMFCFASGAKYAIATTNGTSALHAALYAAGIKAGDEVITTPFTFVASANPILMQGAKVIFADIDETSFNLSPSAAEEKFTEKTAAIIPIDLYGLPFDEKTNSTAKKAGIKIIEDACQSIGAKRNGISCGCLGDAAAFSLYATKNIMCAEGGMVTTNSEEIAESARRFRHHGQSEKTSYEYFELGYNYRMTDVLAAIAVEQMKRLERIVNARNENAKRLTEGLQGINGVVLPSVPENVTHAFHQYTIRITPDAKASRDVFVQKMKEAGIGVGVYYPRPLHLHPHFSKTGYKKGDFPVSERIAGEVASLPVHPQLLQDDITAIIGAARKILS